MPSIPPIPPNHIMQRDLRWLSRRRLSLLRFRGDEDKRQALEDEFKARLGASRQVLAQRLADLPRLGDRPDLPISSHAESIIEALERHQVVIVAGETGSGKSTQLPRLCLEAGRGRAA
jgi:ATP-dependent helicase HrpA